MDDQLTLARPIAQEDLAVGDYVTVLHEIVEWIHPCDLDRHQEVQVRRTPFMCDWAGMPLRVRGVCLPFVLVKTPYRRHQTLDTRRYTLARLDEAYGRATFARMREDRRRAERKKD